MTGGGDSPFWNYRLSQETLGKGNGLMPMPGKAIYAGVRLFFDCFYVSQIPLLPLVKLLKSVSCFGFLVISTNCDFSLPSLHV